MSAGGSQIWDLGDSMGVGFKGRCKRGGTEEKRRDADTVDAYCTYRHPLWRRGFSSLGWLERRHDEPARKRIWVS